MDLSKLSIAELKALGYDLRVQNEQVQNSLRLVESVLQQRLQEQEAATAEALDKSEAAKLNPKGEATDSSAPANEGQDAKPGEEAGSDEGGDPNPPAPQE
jgi:hypothetical protein